MKEIHTILVQCIEVVAMATDPVCFAIVDDDDARFTSTYNDQEYFFCTNYCKKKFDENPKKYSRTACDLTIDSGGASC
jgi:Cu+-exporting ATPase